MKIWIFTVVHNEEAMASWFLRHYGQFADRILVFDDQSTDRTREIFRAHPSVTLFDWPGPHGIDEDYALHFAYDTYPSARGKADWIIWVDCDELIVPANHRRDIRHVLSECEDNEVVTTTGFNMLEPLPINRGGYFHKQLWEINQMGVAAPVYSKPVVFRPEAHVRWVRGKHALEDCEPRLAPPGLLKLLHFRYLGENFTRAKNAKNYNRAIDKGVAWTCSPDFDGADAQHEGSPKWSEWARQFAFNVVEKKI